MNTWELTSAKIRADYTEQEKENLRAANEALKIAYSHINDVLDSFYLRKAHDALDDFCLYPNDIDNVQTKIESMLK